MSINLQSYWAPQISLSYRIYTEHCAVCICCKRCVTCAYVYTYMCALLNALSASAGHCLQLLHQKVSVRMCVCIRRV